ncbi:hypothetical protein DV515_00019067 [Chloebia gouldiae]|uniref:Uncharacterized protein n=1 Tax=Chloebia gouldiae TaxID=44316 RepID=A0A3L8Q5S4_CHLGU|nr:hypothetical protein DV515_00019067 [Chloebia gouldiae]
MQKQLLAPGSYSSSQLGPPARCTCDPEPCPAASLATLAASPVAPARWPAAAMSAVSGSARAPTLSLSRLLCW